MTKWLVKILDNVIKTSLNQYEKGKIFLKIMSSMVGLQRAEDKKQDTKTVKTGVVDGHEQNSEELSKLRRVEI